jgi:hypothetical protein
MYTHGNDLWRSPRNRLLQRDGSGRHLNGYWYWTEAEDAALRRCYPNLAKAKKALPRRSLSAIKSRAYVLQIQRRVHVWTAADISKIRKLARHGTSKDLRAAFPDVRYANIARIARKNGIKRGRPPFVSTGYPLLDEIRERCHRLKYSMADLDDIAKTKRYFQDNHWRHMVSLNVGAIAKAIIALDGTISITWNDPSC